MHGSASEIVRGNILEIYWQKVGMFTSGNPMCRGTSDGTKPDDNAMLVFDESELSFKVVEYFLFTHIGTERPPRTFDYFSNLLIFQSFGGGHIRPPDPWRFF
jgi:hypothetical protein